MKTEFLKKAGLTLAMVCSISACQTETSSTADSNTATTERAVPITEGDWYRPEIGTDWHIQFMGSLDTSHNAVIYDVDLFDTPVATIQSLQASGKKVLCYFSAGSWEDWREDAGNFDSSVIGNDYDGWPGENWLDIDTRNVRGIMKKRLNLAAEKGCDGVDPDNMDSYLQDTGFDITRRQQIKYNRFIANEAHKRNLSVGLKNSLLLVYALVDFYDFQINEQCFAYDECDYLTPFIDAGKPVFNIEYSSDYVNSSSARNQLCNQSINMQFSTLVLPHLLDGSYRYSCLD